MPKLQRLTGLKQPEYIVVSRADVPLAIVPLVVSRWPARVEFPSWRVSGTNNIALLPDADPDGSLCRALLRFMQERYQGCRFRFFDVPVSAPLHGALAALPHVALQERESFHLPLRSFSDFADYKAHISKSLCQTIRTGRNHLNRCRSWRIAWYDCRNLPSEHYMTQLWRLYFRRKNVWRQRSRSLFHAWLVAFEVRRAKNNLISRSLRELDETRLCVLELDGRPIAFALFYLYDHRVVVPRLAIDSDYRSFSPGLVLLDELVAWCFDHAVTDFDLSRGSEPYKARMGCMAEAITRFSGRF